MLQAWPAGAIAPVSWWGSSASSPVKWSTLWPCACGAAGRYDVRVMPERREQLRGDHVPPRGAAQPRHRLAEQREAEVAVVVVLPRARPPRRCRRWRRATRPRPPRVSAPTTGRPARSASRRSARAATPTVASAYPVSGTSLPIGSSSDSSPSSRARITSDGDEGLGDRADPVLRVRGVAGHVAGTADPRHGARRSSTPATTDGSRPWPWSRSRRVCRSLIRRTPRSAGTSRPGCGRRTPGRCGRRAASTCRGPGRPGTRRARARRAAPTSR